MTQLKTTRHRPQSAALCACGGRPAAGGPRRRSRRVPQGRHGAAAQIRPHGASNFSADGQSAPARGRRGDRRPKRGRFINGYDYDRAGNGYGGAFPPGFPKSRKRNCSKSSSAEKSGNAIYCSVLPWRSGERAGMIRAARLHPPRPRSTPSPPTAHLATTRSTSFFDREKRLARGAAGLF